MENSEIVELELPDGGGVHLRAERILPAADTESEGPSNVGLRQALSFSTVSTALRGVAAEVHRAIATATPDVAEVEFGFEVALKGSRVVCLLVDGDTKATIKVRMEWHKSPETAGQ
ncbi:CU044_2847 family protein [Streptomyces sp. NPDC059096]|uniref:CU044_2847 family protein n=1 Tax=Streptomyces sp. NPDC059096 TaxID=3346727 RepID=UPI00369E9F59